MHIFYACNQIDPSVKLPPLPRNPGISDKTLLVHDKIHEKCRCSYARVITIQINPLSDLEDIGHRAAPLLPGSQDAVLLGQSNDAPFRIPYDPTEACEIAGFSGECDDTGVDESFVSLGIDAADFGCHVAGLGGVADEAGRDLLEVVAGEVACVTCQSRCFAG